jgi:hypothetical protein
MSLWFRTRDQDGTVHYVTVPFDPLAPIVVMGIAVALLLPLLVAFRNAVRTEPVLTSTRCVAILLIGFAMFAVAKITVIRAGQFVSYGPSRMKRGMRYLYYLGYVIMSAGAMLVVLFLLVAATT